MKVELFKISFVKKEAKFSYCINTYYLAKVNYNKFIRYNLNTPLHCARGNKT
jgi:hypothetical protein